MMRFDLEQGGDGFDAPLVEGVLWGILLLLAIVLLVRAPRGQRWTWGLILTGLALIVADKAFDVHAVAHDIGQWIAIAIDPEFQLRGPHAIWRNLALGGLFLFALWCVGWLLRHDESIGRAKLLCLAGLAVVGALLAARLAPGIEEYLEDWITKFVELAAWMLVLSGELVGLRRKRQPRFVDGFL